MEEILTLLDATKTLLAQKAAELDLTDATIASIQPVRIVTPTYLPVLDLLPKVVEGGTGETSPVCQALLAAAPYLFWRQTYAEDDGFDRRYLNSYGWFDLAGPAGPATATGIRVMMGYWGQGLVYPDHSHPPEEHYLVLAGSAYFRLGCDPYRKLQQGEIFHTPAGAVHSADMRDEPLLAISIWRHEDLRVRINLTESGRNVERT